MGLNLRELTLQDAIQIGILAVLSAQAILLYLTFRQARIAAETTERYERLKLRPLLKAEWLLVTGSFTIVWRIRNVGLAPAILDRVEVYSHATQWGEHAASGDIDAVNVWRTAALMVLGAHYPGDTAVHMAPMTELKRALGPGEPQETVYIDFPRGDLAVNGLATIDAAIAPVIHFRSLSGELFSTKNQ